MNTIPTPGEHDIQAALEQLSKDDMQALIQHMVQLHPDLAELIVSKQPTVTRKPRAPFNSEIYRLQVEKIFYTTDRNTWGSEARAAQKQTENSRGRPYGADNFNVGIEVAKAVEESHPQEAIDIYQAYVETRIEWRGRENYQGACQYLTSIRRLNQKLGRGDEWNRYMATLREQHRNLPALKDELAKAKL